MAEVGSVIVRAWGAVIKGGLVGWLCNLRFYNPDRLISSGHTPLNRHRTIK